MEPTIVDITVLDTVSIRGTYHGGAYIDLSFGAGPAFDVINVYDCQAGRPTIANDADSVLAEMLEWVDAAGDDLAHDLAAFELNVR